MSDDDLVRRGDVLAALEEFYEQALVIRAANREGGMHDSAEIADRDAKVFALTIDRAKRLPASDELGRLRAEVERHKEWWLNAEAARQSNAEMLREENARATAAEAALSEMTKELDLARSLRDSATLVLSDVAAHRDTYAKALCESRARVGALEAGLRPFTFHAEMDDASIPDGATLAGWPPLWDLPKRLCAKMFRDATAALAPAAAPEKCDRGCGEPTGDCACMCSGCGSIQCVCKDAPAKCETCESRIASMRRDCPSCRKDGAK